MVSLNEGVEVPAPEHGERAEQPPEEEDLGHQEEPHAHPAGIELDVGVAEVVGDVEVRRALGRVRLPVRLCVDGFGDDAHLVALTVS